MQLLSNLLVAGATGHELEDLDLTSTESLFFRLSRTRHESGCYHRRQHRLTSRRRIVEYAGEYGRDFDSLPCSLYYNININEDREAAIEESLKYLDGYYAPQKYSRETVEGWVACGPPEQCVEQLQGFIEAGATDILLRFPSWDQKGQFKRCVEEMLPHLVQ